VLAERQLAAAVVAYVVVVAAAFDHNHKAVAAAVVEVDIGRSEVAPEHIAGAYAVVAVADIRRRKQHNPADCKKASAVVAVVAVVVAAVDHIAIGRIQQEMRPIGQMVVHTVAVEFSPGTVVFQPELLPQPLELAVTVHFQFSVVWSD
jgi:peptidoglycan/LPS O-acetylase OafA/YrhL